MLREELISAQADSLDRDWFYAQFAECLNLLQTANIAERTLAADTTSVWLQRALQIGDTDASRATVKLQDLDEIFHFICENWSDASPALSNALREMYRKTLSLRTKVYPQESFEPWVRYIITFPTTSKALYHGLEPLGKFLPDPDAWGLTEQFYRAAFDLMQTLEHANVTGKALASLLKWRETTSQDKWISIWAPYVYESLRAPSRNNVLIYFLPLIIRQNPSSFEKFYLGMSDRTIEDATGCLKVAHDLDLDIAPLLDDSLTDCLHSASRALRFEVLSLVLYTKQTSKPIPVQIYALLKQNIDVLLGEADPKFRNQVYGVLRQFVFRIRASTYKGVKNFRGEGTSPLVTEAKEFLNWFLEYLALLLRPGTPYRQLVTGFQYLELLVTSGLDHRVEKMHLESSPVPFAFSIDVFTTPLVRDLINNIPNDYQDIRQAAANLLAMAPAPVPYLSTPAEINTIADTATSLISGVRGRQGDGGARVAQLVYRSYEGELQTRFLKGLIDETSRKIDLARTNLLQAVEDHGIHGYFQSLALIAEVADFSTISPALVEQSIQNIKDIWRISKDALTDGAPEGNVPISIDGQEVAPGKHGALGQVILSYCWRAIRESTYLLTVLINRYPSFTSENLKDFGELLMEQLTSIRHRGAFSSVAPAFQACCTRCFTIDGAKDLPREWLDHHIADIQVNTQLITRRSAGLPLLFTSILSAQPKPMEPAVELVMSQLLKLAAKPVPEDSTTLDLPQVHAFNCIRGILSESALTKATVAQAEPSLVQAILAFNSSTWAIRNCGVMLFSTLHNRLFGVRGASMSARVFFGRFKSIKPLLYSHLDRYVREQASAELETVYPVLSLLIRLQAVGDYDGLEEFESPISNLLGSPIWKIREMAAWVLSSILRKNTVLDSATELLKTAPGNQNRLHGHLLAINALAKTVDLSSADAFLDVLVDVAPAIYDENPCFETRIESFKLLQTVGLLPTSAVPTVKGLNPSERVLEAMVDVQMLRDGNGEAAEFLEGDNQDAHLAVLETLVGSEIDAKLVSVIFDLLQRSPVVEVRNACLNVVGQKLSYAQLYPLLTTKQAESVRQKALEFLGAAAARGSDTEREQWIKYVLEFSPDDCPTTSRHASLDSITQFIAVESKLQPGSLRDRLYYELYMFLSDDEESLRDKAASVACKILGAESWASRYCEVPILKLVSPEFLHNKLVGNDNLVEQVKEALQTDETLFVVEKPNLYRNDLVQIAQIDELAASGIPADFAAAEQALDQINTTAPLGWSSNATVTLVKTRLTSFK